MRFAIDKDGKRVHIDSAASFEDYHCPICKEKLVKKYGSKIVHHFSHYPNKACVDNWHYEEKSKWHCDWQDSYPNDKQEIRLESDGKAHIADVFLEEEQTVIEFQHSVMSEEEFSDRNRFYTSLGYRVVWLFDMMAEFKNGIIISLDGSEEKHRYYNPRRLFKSFDYKNKDIIVFFQENDIDDMRLHQIVWTRDKGIDRFCSKVYSKQDFIDYTYGKEKEFTYNKHSIFDIYVKEKCKVMIVRNIDTDDKYMIINDPLKQYQKYKHVYGRGQNTFGEFEKENSAIDNPNEPVWKLVWKK